MIEEEQDDIESDDESPEVNNSQSTSAESKLTTQEVNLRFQALAAEVTSTLPNIEDQIRAIELSIKDNVVLQGKEGKRLVPLIENGLKTIRGKETIRQIWTELIQVVATNLRLRKAGVTLIYTAWRSIFDRHTRAHAADAIFGENADRLLCWLFTVRSVERAARGAIKHSIQAAKKIMQDQRGMQVDLDHKSGDSTTISMKTGFQQALHTGSWALSATLKYLREYETEEALSVRLAASLTQCANQFSSEELQNFAHDHIQRNITREDGSGGFRLAKPRVWPFLEVVGNIVDQYLLGDKLQKDSPKDCMDELTGNSLVKRRWLDAVAPVQCSPQDGNDAMELQDARLRVMNHVLTKFLRSRVGRILKNLKELECSALAKKRESKKNRDAETLPLRLAIRLQSAATSKKFRRKSVS